ncbi:MAG: hypothetical protein GY765_38360 [bacterium]|nr:hypothetical protein [bacterium]
MNFKKFVVLVFVLMFVSGMALFSDAPVSKKLVVKKGAVQMSVKGSVRLWKDVKKISLDEFRKARRARPVLNFERNRTITEKKTIDPVVQSTFGNQKRSVEAASPINDFAGLNQSAHGAGWPPDPTGDVGIDYYVQAVNTSIGIFNKSTGALVSASTFDAFFEGAAVSGTPCDNENNGDPIVLFDRYAQRWFILDFAWASSQTDGSYFAVAVSQTSDPTGAWWQYALRADTTLMNDYPKCGLWHDGIYITANMFQFSGSFQHAKIWALRTPDLYNGTLTVQSVTDSAYEAWAILPSNAKGATPPAGTAPNYMYALDCDEYGSPSIDALYVWKYAVDWDDSANSTWTGPVTLSPAAFAISSSRVPQMDTTNTLDTLAGRLMYPAMYRNFGTHESVYLCHVADVDSKRAMRWYEIRIDGSGDSSIFQQGTYAPDSHHRWMGSVGADKFGNMAMGYSISSDTLYPGVRYAGRLAADPAGLLSQGETSMEEGTGHQMYYSRWGDYSTMTIDPVDDETFWYTQEYYTANGSDWQTRIGSFKLSGSDTTPPTISDVQVDNLTDVSVGFTWFTNEAADSEVQYGLTAAYGSVQSDTSLALNHSIGLSGLTPGATYHYKIVSRDANGNMAETGDFTFTTYLEPPPVSYCVSQGNSQADEYIGEVQIGSLVNASGASPYTDFTAVIGEFVPGETLDVILTPVHSGYSYTEYWTIWIDYNVDGDFDDAGEEVFSGSNTTPLTGSFTLADIEVETRMRVAMKWGSYSTACEEFSYGEVEDYTVKLSAGGASLANYGVLATNSVYLRTGAKVNSGDIAVIDAGTAHLDGGVEVSLAKSITVADGVSIYGDKIKLKAGTTVDDLYYNTLSNFGGTVSGDETTPLELPLDIQLPAFPTPAPGTLAVNVPVEGTETLAPGAYGDVVLDTMGTLFLSGGTYNFESLTLGDYGKVYARAGSELIINGNLVTGNNPVISPEPGTAFEAKDFVIYVNGTEATIGIRHDLKANVYAPNAKLWLKARGVAEGAFIAKDVMVEFYVELALNSAF